MEKQEDVKRERSRRPTQIFKVVMEVKQFDVLTSTYETFEKQEYLLEWLQDVFEQKQAGFHIEDDDTREAEWLQEKEHSERNELHTNMADHTAKKLFFESNQFLSQPLLISLLQKDIRGNLTADAAYITWQTHDII